MGSLRPAASRGLWRLFLTARPLCRRAHVFFQLCCEGCVRRLGLYPPHSPLPQPAVWLGPQSVSSEVAVSLFRQAAALPAFPRFCGSPLGLPVRELPCALELLLFRTSSLPWGTSSCPEVLLLFPFYVYILSPTSFQGAYLSPWRLGDCCGCLEVAL